MSKYIINGGKKLMGELVVDTSKNASLPIIAACLLTDDKVCLKSLPHITDIDKMLKIYEMLGGTIEKYGSNTVFCSKGVNTQKIASNLVGEIRSSIFLLGPMLAKFGRVEIAYPGGCKIGKRPIDLHLKGLLQLGVKVVENENYISCDASKLDGGVVHLDYPSVGATENLMMLAALNKGKSVLISNAAREPEIVDLANFINKMGGKIYGAGTSIITIEGVNKLRGVEYTPISDRIIAGTYLIAAAMNKSKIILKNCNFEDNYSLILKLRNSGCKINIKNDIICVENYKRTKACPIINTQPYPGFPTDLQAQMLALQTISDGVSVVTENLFESRFNHVSQLVKMGAKISVNGRVAIINGVKSLNGAEVIAEDLRGGAALVLAGLAAEGQTVVGNVHYIERGYEALDKSLSKLGADIERR